MTWMNAITIVCTIINLVIIFFATKDLLSRNKYESMSMIDEAELKRKTVGPTPETINLIKSCQVYDDNYDRHPAMNRSIEEQVNGKVEDVGPTRRMVSEELALAYLQGRDRPRHVSDNAIQSSQSIQHEHIGITKINEESVAHQVIEQTKQVTQQQVAQSTKAPVVKARTIQEQRQIITNFLKLKEDTLKPDKVLVKELGTTIGTLEKYATTEQMTEWARLRQMCFSKPRFTQVTQSSVNNTPTSLEQNTNKRIMEA
jgi:hypothetical protein